MSFNGAAVGPITNRLCRSTANPVLSQHSCCQQHQQFATAAMLGSTQAYPAGICHCIAVGSRGSIKCLDASVLERSAAVLRCAGAPEQMQASTSHLPHVAGRTSSRQNWGMLVLGGSSSSRRVFKASAAAYPSQCISDKSSHSPGSIAHGHQMAVCAVAEHGAAAQAAALMSHSAFRLRDAAASPDTHASRTGSHHSNGSGASDVCGSGIAHISNASQNDAKHSNSSSSSGTTGRKLSDAGWQLMQQIVHNTLTWRDLSDLAAAQSTAFTAQHCAAALHKLAALWSQLQQQGQRRANVQLEYSLVLKLASVLLSGLQQQIATAEARDLADAVCAAARLGMLYGQATAALVGEAVQITVAGPAATSAQFISAGFVSTFLQQSQALVTAEKVRPLQLSRMLWAMAKLGLSPASDWWAGVLETSAGLLQQQQQQTEAVGSAGVQHQLQQHQHVHWHQQHHQQGNGYKQQQQQRSGWCFNSQDLALTGWAVAKLAAPASNAWWECYMAAAQQSLPHMAPQHLSNCIWALATAGQVPSSKWSTAFYAASAASMSSFSAQALANTLWALGTLGLQPPLLWLQQFEAASAVQLPNSSMQHLSMMLWAVGKLHDAGSMGQRQQQQRQQQQVQELVHAAVPLHANNTRAAAAVQQLDLFPSASWLEQVWVQLARVESDVTPQGLACVLWALVQLGRPISEQRLQQLEKLAIVVLQDAKPQALVMVVWALGVLRGPACSRNVVKRVRRYCQLEPTVLQQLTPQGLFMLLHGLSKMRAWHPNSFKQQLLAAVSAVLDRGPQQGFTNDAPSSAAAHIGACADSMQSCRTSFSISELPLVLLSLSQLQIAVPTSLLQQTESLLEPQLPHFTPGQLSLLLFALGQVRHSPSSSFLAAAGGRMGQVAQLLRGRDVAHALYGLATMGGCLSYLSAVQQQGLVQQLLSRAQQVLADMNHSSLATFLWSVARLNLRPSEQLLRDSMALTTQLLPSMTLLSVTTILAALCSLEYLPPVAWMVETCSAARANLNTDPSPKPWQRRDCVRRLEESVAWYIAAMQQQVEANGVAGSSGSTGGAAAKQVGMLSSAGSSSDAMIAAAVGVAAAVAQHWPH